MDPGLLARYNQELAHLREVGAEFAQAFPKIAGRLTMDGLEVADPYVERLLEGFAFMAARTQLKLDAEYPRFVQSLLTAVAPNFLAPVPSMLVARLQPDWMDPALAQGFTLPRGSSLTSPLARGQGTHCEFRTGQAVTLWPLELTGVRYAGHVGDLPLAQLPQAHAARGARAVLRLSLRVHGGLTAAALPLDRLPFYLAAPDDTALRLFELLVTAALGTFVPTAGAAAAQWAAATSLAQQGFDDDQALLPETPTGFSGHRLLQEYAAMPQRLMAFELRGLAPRLRAVAGDRFDIVIALAREDAALEALVDAQSLALYCTPAINLFTKRLDRVTLAGANTGGGAGTPADEHHLIPDRTRPMDYEVHTVTAVTGHGTGAVAEQAFTPLYTAHHTEGPQHRAYYTLRREPRLISLHQRAQGTRSAYVGSEVFITLVDPEHAPYDGDLRQLAVQALVSNRDLPSLLPGAGQQGGADAISAARAGWALDATAPVTAVQVLRGPTPVVPRLPRGDEGWALVSQLTLNHLSIAGDDPAKAAAALRSLLLLHGHPADAGWRRQVESLRAVSAHTVTRRLPGGGRLAFGSGVRIRVEVDELGLHGHTAALLGSVLERWFARHAAVNSFTETELHSATRGLIMAWPPRLGQGPLL